MSRQDTDLVSHVRSTFDQRKIRRSSWSPSPSASRICQARMNILFWGQLCIYFHYSTMITYYYYSIIYMYIYLQYICVYRIRFPLLAISSCLKCFSQSPTCQDSKLLESLLLASLHLHCVTSKVPVSMDSQKLVNIVETFGWRWGETDTFYYIDSVDWLALVYVRFVGVTSTATSMLHSNEHQATSFGGQWVWVEWCSNAWWQPYHLDLSVGNSTVLQGNPFRSLAFSLPWRPGINYQMKLQSHSDCITVKHLIPTVTQQ